ncbi:D-2-hydroxyacid dehydrogenase [Bacillus massiliglaciei]|uniref:D-2-hydroxyacid dehydrogenase n=1 Tax=Bacillus massiliglaciei TaxID=1816693 RepID=UPI000A74632A|nr:D-2-hydroxyacid dehydrogenase [Bacillus massiliglaciei]
MLILSTIIPPQAIQKEMERKFPNEQFVYRKGWDEDYLSKAEILITYGEDLTEAEIQKAGQLKWIMVMSAGLEKMPLSTIAAQNILVTNARGIHKIQMAEYTIGVLLQYEKRLKRLIAQEEKGVWDRKLMMGELAGKKMAVLGTGAIGGEIARLAKAFRMETIGVNRSGRSVEHVDRMYRMEELDAVLAEADYVVSILPSTPETRHLLQPEHFKRMKKSAVFVNLGRGDLVKSEDLMDALQKGEIAHAFLDVFDQEPLKPDHPFWTMDNVTVTPHVSSKTDQYLPRSFRIFEENFKEYTTGGENYINRIDLEKGY